MRAGALREPVSVVIQILGAVQLRMAGAMQVRRRASGALAADPTRTVPVCLRFKASLRLKAMVNMSCIWMG